MTGHEQIEIAQLNTEFQDFKTTVLAYMAEDNAWKKEFVQPLIEEKAQRVVVENWLKRKGSIFLTILGVVVSLSLLFRNLIAPIFAHH